MVELEKTMFRDYDIRGNVNEKEFNEKSMGFIARGFGTMLSRKGIADCIVGFDARSYSERLANAFISGLLGTGVNVKNIGMVTTPVGYFSQYLLKAKGIALLTASHNPNGWSGLKLGYGFSSTFLPKDILELYEIIKKEDFAQGSGKEQKLDVVQAYAAELSKRVKIGKKFRVVVNARNGIAGPIYPLVLRAAGIEVAEQYCNVDFDYPHGISNPSIDEMMLELGVLVRKQKADLGIAFDADGDRLGITDEKGKVIYPDRILLLLARRVLEEKPGSPIIFDVKCTQALAEDIEKHGGKPIMWKTGHSFIKEKLHELNAPLAGERSGHIFYREGYYGFDDACFAALKLLEYLGSEKKTLSKIMGSTPKYFSSQVWHAPCADEMKKEVVARLVKKLKEKYSNVIDIDGARVVFKDGWGLVRTSSNMPVLVLVFEAKTKKRLAEIEKLFRKELAAFPEIGKDWDNG